MNDSEIEKIAKSEYYGDKNLSEQCKAARRRIESMIQERNFKYKDEATRIGKDR